MERQLTARQILNFEIPAFPDYVGVVRKAVVELARNLGFTKNEVDELKLAVGEALSNAVQHCTPRTGDRCIAVTLAITPEGLVVEISNQADP
jgi:serine/threonine-protein kinase RsbW